ncbi:MAG TPA: hypothetical protein VF173_37465 [Thermoanaerobaculia bacterium]|nr:hypothetical protein [Thermoanaerobaculia bacterium]
MSRRRFKILCLWFLASPLAAGQPAPSPFRPGGVSLELSDSAFSALSVSVPALRADLCKAYLPPKSEGDSQCHPKPVKGPHGVTNSLTLEIVETLPAKDGTVVRLFPRALNLAGPRLFNNACGTWRYWLTLDPRATQQISKAVLHTDTGGALSGEVHGALPMAAVLHIEAVHGRQRTDMPLTLHLDLTGRWTALPLPLAAGVLDPAASNLVLFAESPGKPGGKWAGRKECTRLSPFVGEVCLSASPSLLKSLNVNP